MKKEICPKGLARLVDEHYELVETAFADGVVTIEERRRIKRSLVIVRMKAEGVATRWTLGMRIANGGVVDRDIQANVRSYGRWTEEETKRLARLEPSEATELAA